MAENNNCFIYDDRIPAPNGLNSQSDFELLFLHVISHFYDEIITYGRRTQLIISVMSILTEYIPFVYPQYFSDYPDSLPDIYTLVEETIKINQEKQKNPDPLPDIYKYMNEEMQTIR